MGERERNRIRRDERKGKGPECKQSGERERSRGEGGIRQERMRRIMRKEGGEDVRRREG